MRKMMIVFSIVGMIFAFAFVATFNYQIVVSIICALMSMVALYIANVFTRMVDDDETHY